MEKGRQLGGEPLTVVGFFNFPLVFNKVKEENLGTAFSRFSLPKKGVKFSGRDRGKLRVGSIQAPEITF